ncbi:MAG: hypothetical protein ACXWG8_08205 [Usitatibacter sp.]
MRPMRLGAIVMALAAMAAAAEPSPAVDPRSAGAQLPPEGRSLFDFVVAEGGSHSVPFPFEALLARIADRCGASARGGCLDAVLIPLGRSLQRTAAAPDFFRYPRVVAAVDREPRARAGRAEMLLKDRLYLGYQEKAGVVEVISYNEAAGRFEFQVVRNYRAGATPRVFYANRVVCTACHQNHAPIFSRAAWDETNANPKIAALLERQARQVHGIPIDRGVDIPNAIDDATDRATFFPAYQLLWREGCEGATAPARCRAALFTAALQYRLSDGRSFDERAESFQLDFASPFAAQWRSRWPLGLSIATADLPNRDPLSGAPPLADVPARFDPLEARPPVETWAGDSQETQRRLVGGLAGFLAETDIRALDDTLFQLAAGGSARRRTYTASCVVTGSTARSSDVEFACVSADAPGNALRLSGRIPGSPSKRAEGEIGALVLDGERGFGEIDLKDGRLETNAGETVARFQASRRGRHVRLRDGNAIEQVSMRWHENSGEATVTAIEDFAPAAAAIGEMEGRTTQGELDVFSAKPFRRAAVLEALFTRLGVKGRRWCCLDASGMPPPRADEVVLESAAAREAPAPLKPLYQFCGTCHFGPERSPPNFLQGDASRVDAKLKQCAERLYVRLGMWQLPADARAKSPMPPAAALAALDTHSADWERSAELAALQRFAAGLLRSQGGAEPSLAALTARSYETLRPCLNNE